MIFGHDPWELLFVVLVGGWIGWFLHDALRRWRQRSAAAKRRAQLERTTRQAVELVRGLQTESVSQKESLRSLEDALAAGRQHHQASEQELVALRALGRLLERQVEALRSVRPDQPARTEASGEAGAGGLPPEELWASDEKPAKPPEDLETSHRKLAEAEDRCRALQQRLERATRQERQSAQEIEGLRKDLAASHQALFQCDQRVTERDARIYDLEATLGAQRAAVPAEDLETEARYLTLVAEKEQRIADLERELDQRQRQPAATAAAGDGDEEPLASGEPRAEKDDLKKIRGIGPALERRLAELGVTSFRQIAGWDEAEIERIGGQLGRFRDRIRRDGWVAGARDEYNRKYGRPPGED